MTDKRTIYLGGVDYISPSDKGLDVLEKVHKKLSEYSNFDQNQKFDKEKFSYDNLVTYFIGFSISLMITRRKFEEDFETVIITMKKDGLSNTNGIQLIVKKEGLISPTVLLNRWGCDLVTFSEFSKIVQSLLITLKDEYPETFAISQDSP